MEAKFCLIFIALLFHLLLFNPACKLVTQNIRNRKSAIFPLPPNAHNFQSCCNLIAL